MMTRPVSPLSADDYKTIVRQIGRNHYFTNHGPLATRFERELEAFLDIDHVVAVGSEDLALLIALAAMQLEGDVVVPAFRSDEVMNVCRWLDLEPKLCDVDTATHQPSIDQLSDVVDDSVQAVCVIECWGNRCPREVIRWLAQQKKRVVVVAAESFASLSNQRFCHAEDHVVTVLGFSPGSVLSTMEGGAIATTDPTLAERCRNIRSSYGTRSTIDVVATCNGRFSEFQAGVGLKALEYLPKTLKTLRSIASDHSSVLGQVAGIEPFTFPSTDVPNHQCYPICVSKTSPLSALELHDTLRASGLRTGVAKPSPAKFPNAHAIAQGTLILPLNRDRQSNSGVSVAQAIANQSW